MKEKTEIIQIITEVLLKGMESIFKFKKAITSKYISQLSKK